MKNKIKHMNKDNGSAVIEILILITLITFIIFFPVATHSISTKQNQLNDILMTSLQAISVEGGLTDTAEKVISDMITNMGLNTSYASGKIKLICSADARGGATSNIVYKNDDSPIITFELYYPATTEVTFINSLNKLISGKDAIVPFAGNEGEYMYVLKGSVLSEKVEN